MLACLLPIQVHGVAWRAAAADNAFKLPELEAAIVEYQRPEKADSILRVRAALDEVTETAVR